MDKRSHWSGWHTFALAVFVLLFIAIGMYMPAHSRFFTWICMLILLLVFCLIAGNGVTGLWRGLLIDERNKMSLSRLQLALWSVIILSGFSAAVFSNICARVSDPLAIVIPEQLWALLGISTTSLVGTPLIRSTKTKTNKKPSHEALQSYAALKGIDEKEIPRRGLIEFNKDPEQATWSNIFEGEEIGSEDHLDLGKVQMFYFTLILVIVYVVDLGILFGRGASFISELPKISSSMIALLAISHGGYLVDKAVPKS
jgi:signal transduction histidine kinase